MLEIVHCLISYGNMQQRPLYFEGNRLFGEIKNAAFLHNQLCDSIEEVGASYVVQVVTDTTSICKVTSILVQKRYKHIFW